LIENVVFAGNFVSNFLDVSRIPHHDPFLLELTAEVLFVFSCIRRICDFVQHVSSYHPTRQDFGEFSTFY
jgi:hypothetical protein